MALSSVLNYLIEPVDLYFYSRMNSNRKFRFGVTTVFVTLRLEYRGGLYLN